jgi:hypothetical protein
MKSCGSVRTLSSGSRGRRPGVFHSPALASHFAISRARFSFWSQMFRKYRLKEVRSPSDSALSYSFRILSSVMKPSMTFPSSPNRTSDGFALYQVAGSAGSSSAAAP